MKELHVYQPANCIQLDSPAVNPTVRMLLTVLYELQPGEVCSFRVVLK